MKYPFLHRYLSPDYLPGQEPHQGYAPQPAPQQSYTPQAAPQQGYAPQPAPQQGYTPQAAPQQGYAPQAAPQQFAPKPPRIKKRSPFMTALVISLSVVLVVESAVACFWYPGFFTGGGGQGENGPASDEMILQLANEPLEEIDPSLNPEPVKVSDIVSIYSDEEIANAPKTEIRVSPDTPKASAGKFSVDFAECNIFSDDTFVVKELPVHENKEGNYTVTGYDFSLASGQDEFYNEVIVSVPRDAEKDVDVRFITKDKKTGKYKREYFEISEDGSSYLIYTNHFSEHDKLTYSDFTEGVVVDILNAGAKSQAALDTLGTFYYPRKYGARQRMSVNVDCDRDFMWNVVAPRYTQLPDGIDLLPEIAKQIKSIPKDQLAYSAPLTAIMWANGTVDYTNSAVSVIEASVEVIMNKLRLKNMSSQIKAAAANSGAASKINIPRIIGGIACLISYFLTVDKICHDEEQGKYASWIDAYKENWLGILGIGVGIVGTVVGTGGVAIGAAVAGMILFGASVYYAATSPRELSQVEQVFRDYFVTPSGKSRVRIYYGDEQYKNKVDEGKGYMKPLTSLSGDVNVLLAYFINYKIAEYGLGAGIPGDDPMRFKNTDLTWTTIISGLFHLINEHVESPDYEKIFTEFYHNYAEACFNMDNETYLSFARKDLAERHWDPTTATLPEQAATGDGENLKEDYINNMVKELMAKHQELFWKNVVFTMHCAQVEAQTIIEEELVPKLNTVMEFRIVDNALADPKDFSQSAFNVPGRLNKDVDMYRSSYYGYADLSKCVDYPMYFSIQKDDGSYSYVEKPVFMPRESSGGKTEPAKYTDYYPARGNFVPKWSGKKGDNLVFRCTYFHYMMMGSPTAVSFRDMKDLGKKDKIAPMTFSEPDANGVIQVTIEAPRLDQPDSADMKVIEDGSMSYLFESSTLPEYQDHPMPADVSFSVNEDGKHVDFVLPAADLSFSTSTSTENFSDITYTYSHHRDAVTLKGKITNIEYDSAGNVITKRGVILSTSGKISGGSKSESTRKSRDDGSLYTMFSKNETESDELTLGDETYDGDPSDDNVSAFYIHYSDDPKKKDHVSEVYIYLKGKFRYTISDSRDPDVPYTTSKNTVVIGLKRVD